MIFFLFPFLQIRTTPISAWWAAVTGNVGRADFLRSVKTQDFLKDHDILDYEDLKNRIATSDPHSVYPTNIYRYSGRER